MADVADRFTEIKRHMMTTAAPSAGDELTGMVVDFEHYLVERCPSLATATISTTADPGRLVVAMCTAHPDAVPASVAHEIESVWTHDLRYPFREAHRSRQSTSTVELDFTTQIGAGDFFVTGVVIVRWPAAS